MLGENGKMNNRARRNQSNISNEPTGKQAEMTVMKQSRDLELYSVLAVFNLKIFAKKFRPGYTNNMLDHIFAIRDGLTSANELDLRIDYERIDRYRNQKKALIACKCLMNRIETAHELGIIDDDKFAFWQRLIVNVKNLTGAWTKSDEKRGFPVPLSVKGESL
jgi:hypothetical protein